MSNLSMKLNRESIDVAIGRRVHTLLWERRIKNKDIGQLLGLDPTGVGKKLRGESKFSVEQLVAVASHLDTTVGYLVGEVSSPDPDGDNRSRLRESNPRPFHYKGKPRPIAHLRPAPAAA